MSFGCNLYLEAQDLPVGILSTKMSAFGSARYLLALAHSSHHSLASLPDIPSSYHTGEAPCKSWRVWWEMPGNCNLAGPLFSHRFTGGTIQGCGFVSKLKPQNARLPFGSNLTKATEYDVSVVSCMTRGCFLGGKW